MVSEGERRRRVPIVPREEWEGGERMKKVLLRPPILLRRRLERCSRGAAAVAT